MLITDKSDQGAGWGHQPRDVCEELVCARLASSSFQVETEGSHRPFSPVDVIVLLLKNEIKSGLENAEHIPRLPIFVSVCMQSSIFFFYPKFLNCDAG